MEQATKTQQGFQQVIVVAVDLSSASDAAVLAGVRIARPGDALHIIHTAESKRLIEVQRIVEEASILERDPGEIQTYFNDVCVAAGDWPAVKPQFSTCIGSPVEAILQFTVDVEAHVLVCGTHARHGVDRLLHGSVAESLARESHCPVLIAKERSYAGCQKSDRAAPVCADCTALRVSSGDAAAWCQVHARTHGDTHSYAGAPSRRPHPASFNIPS